MIVTGRDKEFKKLQRLSRSQAKKFFTVKLSDAKKVNKSQNLKPKNHTSSGNQLEPLRSNWPTNAEDFLFLVFSSDSVKGAEKIQISVTFHFFHLPESLMKILKSADKELC